MHRYGEPDTRVIQLGSRRHARSLCRKWCNDAKNLALNIEQRPTVIHWRYCGIGLDGSAPASAYRRNNAYRDAWLIEIPYSANSKCPFTCPYVFLRNKLSFSEWLFRITLEKNQTPIEVSSSDSSHKPFRRLLCVSCCFLLWWQRDDYFFNIRGNGKFSSKNPTIGSNDKPTRWTCSRCPFTRTL